MGTPAHLSHPSYRPDVDGLRAVAVVSVLAFHAFPSVLPGGFIGVDVFFVISGYLISRIIDASLSEGRFSLAEFYARRVKRIFPALLLVLSACYAFAWFTLFADEFQQLGKHIAGGAGFVSNWLFWDESGYFDSSAETKPLLHLWSLGIEEQFYFVWPIALWAAWKCRLNGLWLAGVLACASFAWSIHCTSTDAVSAFYLPHARAWELLTGATLAYLERLRRDREAPGPRSIWLGHAASLAGVALLGFGLYATNSTRSFPGWWALPPTVGAALCIFAGPHACFNRILLARRALVLIGLVSFPLYLWHWPFLAFARVIQGEEVSARVRAAALVLALLFSILTYRFVERPLRAPQAARKWPIPILLVGMVAIGAAGLAAFLVQGFPERAAAASAQRFQKQFAAWPYENNRLCKTRYPFPEARAYSAWFCMINRDADPTLLVLGTSYANHLYPGLVSNPHTQAHTILSIGSCSVELGYIEHNPSLAKNFACNDTRPAHQRQLIDELVKKAGTVKYAIIDGLSYQRDDEFIPNLERRVTFLEENGIQVIVFVPHIRANHRNLRGCFARRLHPRALNCDLEPTARDDMNKDFAPVVARLSHSHPAVKFFDQNQVFCDAKGCSLIRDGMPLFRDQRSHYSEYGSEQVAKLFVAWAKTNAPGILLE
ncbi:MAG: acyltransferase family protein [Pseudomonadota bacterium]